MTDKVQDKETGAQQPAGTASDSTVNELNLNDLNAMKVIIDIASSRGAFKPNEMVAVGQTYNKLSAFLEQVAKQSETAKQGA